MKNRAQDLMITISAVGLLIVLAVGAVAVTGKVVATKNPVFMAMAMARDEYVQTEVVVQPGDTLWSIARTQVPSEDPRDVVGSMRDLNQLASADIFPGQVLTVLVRQSAQPLQLAEGLPAQD
jgi:1,2-phenylacetyl-CoA epoxidase PaaB subunit